MASIHCAPLLAAILLLIPAVLAQSVPTTSTGQAMLDQPLVGDVALPPLGGQLTSGVDMAFAVAADKYPNTVNTGAVTLGFTVVTALPVGGQVTFTVPKGYFTNVDSSKVNTFTGTSATCKCVGSAGTTTDAMTCTVAGAGLAVGATTLSMAVGALTTGAPTAASTYNVQTTTDRSLSSAPATQQIGGVVSSPVDLVLDAADRLPNRVNTVAIAAGFTVATPVPIGGKITLTFPKAYLSAVSSSAVTFAGKTTATCVLNAATGTGTKDTVVCTTAVDVLAAAAQTLTFAIGSITTGLLPQSASTYTVSTSTDRESATKAVPVLGSTLSAGATMGVTTNDKVPGVVSSGLITVGFTVVTPIPIGGKITIALPSKYFSAFDSTVTHSFTTGTTAARCTCVLTAGVTGTSVLGVSSADTLICTTSAAIVAAALQVVSFAIGSVTTGVPQAAATYTVATSTDQQIASAPATIVLGSTLSAGAAMTFAQSTDQVPGTVNTGLITVGFTVVTPVPIGGKFTIALPSKYFSTFDSTKVHSFTTGTTAARCTCVLTAGVTDTSVLGISSADTLICTTSAAIVAAAPQVVSFAIGSVTTGVPQIVATYNVATSTDIQVASAPATLALGSTLTGGTIAFSVTADKVPGTVNTGTITVGFTVVTAIPTGGKITVTVPRGYFAKVDESKANTLTTPSTTTATCALVQATGVATTDSIVCTTSASVTAAGQTLTFIAGAVTTGGAVLDVSSGVTIATSTDVKSGTTPTAVALGGQFAAGVDMAFTNSDDKVPGKFTSNNATITLGFTVITAIPIGGKITITLPQRYFTAVDGTKDNTVGTSTTAKCALANVAQTTVPAAIALSASTVATSTTLTVSFVPSIVSGVTQVVIPLVGFSLDSAVTVECTANCVSNSVGKVTAALANGVLTLTLTSDNFIVKKNVLTTIKLVGVTTPATAGWATTGISAIAFNPSATVVCTTAGAAVVAGATVFTFIAGSVTIGAGQKASFYQLETSTDLPIAPGSAKATVALGGGLTIGKPLAFANTQDAIPGRVNSGAVTLGATLANSVPIGGQFLLTFPSNYFTAVNPLSVVTLTKGTRRSLLQTSTLSCVRTAGATVDQITCTLAGAASGTGAVVITFPAGSLTTGLPTSTSGGFNLATASPPVGTTRIPYFPKAAGSAYGVASLLVALSALLACL